MADYQHDGYNALVSAALDRATLRGQPMYVYVTASQWIVDPRPPAFDRQHLRCEPDPVLVVGCSRALGAGGYWTETVLWPRELVAFGAARERRQARAAATAHWLALTPRQRKDVIRRHRKRALPVER